MKFMGLLSVGRSVVRASDETHYNLMNVKTFHGMDWERLEPPVPARDGAEPALASAPSRPTVQPGDAAVRESLEKLHGLLTAAAASPRPGFWARLRLRLRPSRWDWANLLTGRSRRRGAEGLAQPELFILQQVKPMRNDLSDSDLDIVPSRRSRSEGRAGEKPARERTGPVWRRLSKRSAGNATP